MDLSLDLDPNSASYGDLLTLDGNLVLTSDVDPRGTHPILQNVVQRLRINFGEWFLNRDLGVPYFQQILVKNPDYAKNEATIREAILATPGVLSLSEFSMTSDNKKRVLNIAFKASTIRGPISYSGPANSPYGAGAA